MSMSYTMHADSNHVRFRPDIEWVSYENGKRWVARDPISGAFYYFSDEEHNAAKLLCGKWSSLEIASRLQKSFPNKPISIQWLQILVSRLSNSHLLLPQDLKQYEASQLASARRQFGVLKQVLISPLSIRIPIWKPSGFSMPFRFLARLVFHPIMASLLIVALLTCGFMVLGSLLADPGQLIYDVRRMQGDRLFLILVLYLLIKSLHELGHVLACARWGAECKEIGVLLLFFTPCLYCDTTDCWKLPSKWQRAAVSGAGIYVELVIACVAAAVWLSTRDGLEHTLAASTMLMCSLGTLLINGNPCFKYDGYFALSDLWGVPNLAQQGSSALWQYFVYLLGGRKPNPTDFDRNVLALASFSIVSTFYRILVLVLLVSLVWIALVPLGLGLFAVFVLASISLGLIAHFVKSAMSLYAEFFTSHPIKVMRFLILVAALFLAVSLAAMLPIPNYIRARAVLDFENKSPIYAPQTAVIRSIKNLDAHFEKGEIVLELDCPEKESELRDLNDEISLLTAKCEILKKNTVNDSSSAYELPSQLEILRELESKRELLIPEIKSLILRAPTDGYFIPSSIVLRPAIVSPIDLRFASHPTHSSNLGCLIERGTLIGWFTSKQEVLFRALVSESSIKEMRTGMKAECILDSDVTSSIRSKVARIAHDPIAELPQELVGDPMLVSLRNEKGLLQPETPHYQVTLESQGNVTTKIKGTVASVFFQLEAKTAIERFVRYIRLTIK